MVANRGFFVSWEHLLTFKVTGLKPQKRRKDRISVFLDGDYAFGLQEIVAAKLWVGQELSAQEIEALKEADSIEWSKQTVFRLLTHRPRSTTEVRRHLRKKNVEDDTIDRVIDRLLELELLDDRAFAQYWVEQRETFRPRSRRALQYELYQKGLDRRIVEEAVAEVDEMAAARKAGQKKALQWAHLPEEEFHQKMRGFLNRRGFDYAVISEVSRELWRGIEERDGPNEK